MTILGIIADMQRLQIHFENVSVRTLLIKFGHGYGFLCDMQWVPPTATIPSFFCVPLWREVWRLGVVYWGRIMNEAIVFFLCM